MFDVFGSVRGLLKIDSVCIDNNVFRLHYKVTVIILVAFSLIVTSRQYIGDPIDCIVDNIQPDVMDAYCWIYSTYTVKSRVMGKIGSEVAAPGVAPYVKDDEIIYHKYYQWVCFALFFQAMLFYVPRYLWKTWEGGKIKTLASDLLGPIVSEDVKQDRKQLLVEFFLANIHNHNFYAFRFFICELLNFINVVVQIYFMDAFMGGEFSNYGWNVMKFMDSNTADEREDAMERVFPKLTKCKFHTYGSTGTIQVHDGLCILPLNIVNEKIYLFLWFWFFILAIISFVSVIYRFFVIANPKLRLYLLRARCRFTSQSQIEQISSRLKIGDWFVLYQLAKNIEPFIFKEIVSDIAKSIFETKQAV